MSLIKCNELKITLFPDEMVFQVAKKFAGDSLDIFRIIIQYLIKASFLKIFEDGVVFCIMSFDFLYLDNHKTRVLKADTYTQNINGLNMIYCFMRT